MMKQLLQNLLESTDKTDESIIQTAIDVFNVVENRRDPLSDALRSSVLDIVRDKKSQLDRTIDKINSVFGDISDYPEEIQDFHIKTMAGWQRQSRRCGELLSRAYSIEKTIP